MTPKMKKFLKNKYIISLYEKAVKLSPIAPLPFHLSIEITDKCNLKCPMCPRNFVEVKNQNLEFEKFQYVLSQIPTIREITLLGRGETFLHPELDKILSLGVQKKLKFTIVTNGVSLIENLPNVEKLVVSIDHPEIEGYKKIRGANLEKIIENIKKIKNKNPKIYIIIQSLILKDNIYNLSKFLELCQKCNADSLTLINLIAFDENLDKMHGYNFSDVKEILKNLQRKFLNSRIKLVSPLNFTKKKCFEPWYSVRISIEGDVYPCCYIYESSFPLWTEYYKGYPIKVPQYLYKMGNIFKTNFWKIWNNERYINLRLNLIKLNFFEKYLDDKNLIKLRKKVNIKKNFSYCKVCLYRLNRNC